MTTQPIASETETIQTPQERAWPCLCWKAVLAGTVTAIGIQILLSMLGIGAGLAMFSPITDANSVSHFNIGAAVIWSVSALISLWFGGMLAGRFSHSSHTGFVHGVLVWSLTLIITLLLLSAGTGMILGGGLKIVSQGVDMAGQATAAGLGDVAKDSTKRTGEELNSFIAEATQCTSTNGNSSASVRSKRDISFAVAKLFAPENDINSADNRAAAINALSASNRMSEADATTMVDNWIASYKNTKAELDHAKQVAEQKARQVADQGARNLSCAAIWSFFALLIGLIVTALGGSCGGKCAARHAANRVVTVSDAPTIATP